ncbi:MAG: hydrogenase, partial [Deltaproteobacteria bacterium RBG_13_49_15]
AKHGETLQSHFLHLFFLVAPDFFKVASVIPLIETHRAVVEVALRLKKTANDMCDVIAGRTTHPVSFCVGGMSKIPDKKMLAKIKKDLLDRIPDVEQAVGLFSTLKMPEFIRETEFVSLKGETNYPWIGGKLISSDGVEKAENDYLDMTNEYVVDFSTSKFTKLSRKSFAVGALARFNNNYTFLNKPAKALAEQLNFKPVNHNPFMFNAAQLVESVHALYESIDMINELLDSDIGEIRVPYDVKEGEGIGAVEVPRGILYHHYQINDKGKIEKANCIIPTTQNNANIHYDIAELVKQEVKKGEADAHVTLMSEMLVRAYDPCISCSVH